MAYVVKKRCTYCRKVLREDKTCQNPACPLYKPEVNNDATEKAESVGQSE